MGTFRIGKDSLGIPSIKITRDGVSPKTVADDDFKNIYYNSKTEQLRFTGQDKQDVVGGDFRTWYPAGSGPSNFKRLKYGDDLGYNNVFWKNEFWKDLGPLDYELPLFDLRPIASNGWTIYGSIQKAIGSLDTKWYLYTMLYAGWAKGYYLGNGSNFPLDGTQFTALAGYCETSTWGPGRSVQAIVYNLPGDDTDILYPPTDPVPGQKIIDFRNGKVRVAKPGYSVEDIAAKLAFDSANRPAKIIASGDILLPSGAVTSFDFSAKLAGINVDTSSIVVDVLMYKGSTIVFPASIPNDEDDYGCPYRVNGQTIEFSNSGSACRARFIVIAQDSAPQSAGGGKVFRRLLINGEKVFQLVRPGAADTPSLADVIIDTRWPALQIVKTGVLDIPPSGGAAVSTDVLFESAGLFPFIKYHTIHPSGLLPYSNSLGTVNSPVTVQKLIRQPQVAAGFVRNSDSGAKISYISGETTICQLTLNRARFFTYRGGPYRMLYDGGVQSRAVRNPATKIRYYIFGIPADGGT